MRFKKTKKPSIWSRVAQLPVRTRQFLNFWVIVVSVLLCLLLLPTRLPGMALLGIGPNWLLIWVVAWSVKRSAFLGTAAGFVLGLLQDGMTAPHPTHAISLAVVGFLTARLQKQRYVQEDFISVAFIVFGMALLADTLTAIQYSFYTGRALEEIWTQYQLVTLSSAILSSLWAPVIYYPLDLWWKQTNLMETS